MLQLFVTLVLRYATHTSSRFGHPFHIAFIGQLHTTSSIAKHIIKLLTQTYVRSPDEMLSPELRTSHIKRLA